MCGTFMSPVEHLQVANYTCSNSTSLHKPLQDIKCASRISTGLHEPSWELSSGGAPTPAGTSVFTKHNWDMGTGYL